MGNSIYPYIVAPFSQLPDAWSSYYVADSWLGAADGIQYVARFSQGEQPGCKKMLGDFTANTQFCLFVLKLYVAEQ